MLEPVLVVDVDVLFLLNLAVNLAWLWGTARMAGAQFRLWRLALASAVGAVLAVLYYFPAGAWIGTLPGLLAGSALVLLLAFWPSRMGRLLRLAAVFFVSGGAQAGLALLLATRRSAAGVAGTNDALVAVGVVLFGVGARYLWEALRSSGSVLQNLYSVEMELDGRTVRFEALLDTGNSLRDPLTGTPAAIVEVDLLAPLLPRELVDGVRDGWRRGVESIPADWFSRCRLLPYRAVGLPTGLLLAVRPDRLTVRHKDGLRDWRVLIAVTKDQFHPDRLYQGLLPGISETWVAEVIGEAGGSMQRRNA